YQPQNIHKSIADIGNTLTIQCEGRLNPYTFSSLSRQKKIEAIKSDRGGVYYDRYDELEEQCPRPFVIFLKECVIVSQYIMSGKPSINGMTKQRN
ncbi:hypothetical protein CR513_45727, partial [Mucuna pruriens]